MKLRSLYLKNFRSYEKLNLEIKDTQFVVLTGKNGIGKTNLLEAISFLSPGKGFKNCNIEEVIKSDTKIQKSNIFFILSNGKEKNEIGIEFLKEKSSKEQKGKKIIFLNGKKIQRQTLLPDIISLIWLTPEMDIFFRTNSLFRRKFLDRCIFNLTPQYLEYLKLYDKNVQERRKILKDIAKKDLFYILGKYEEKDLWLNKIEEKIVEISLKIFSDRNKFVKEFNSLLNNFKNFPKIKISLNGKIEELLIENNNEKNKKIYLEKLISCRKIDSIKGNISYGPSKSDLKVLFLKKGIFADECSTGEQKIILISLIIQFCKLMNEKKSFPILLLDEIIAHLDEKVKESLFEELKSLKNQIWMTGAEIDFFVPIIKNENVLNLKIEDYIKQ